MQKLVSKSLVALLLSHTSMHVLAEEMADSKKQTAEKRDIYDNENKDANDPTRVVTKLGIGGDYNFETEDFATPFLALLV